MHLKFVPGTKKLHGHFSRPSNNVEQSSQKVFTQSVFIQVDLATGHFLMKHADTFKTDTTSVKRPVHIFHRSFIYFK